MAELDTIRHELIRSDSDINIAYEEYEYMLGWYNKYGSPVQWLFKDWENNYRVQASQFNIEDSDTIRGSVNSESNEINLVAEDITRQERLMFESLFISRTVYRLFRPDSQIFQAGGFERLAVVSGGIRWIQSKQRFQINATVKKAQSTLWR